MAVGFFGKILTHGDFVSRRLPADWIHIWDHWLQQCISCSRRQLGEQWTEHYLVSPMCRFMLGCGSVDQHAWAGILMPSVDRVGRYYPLTLASPIEVRANLAATYLANPDWFLRLERLALSTLSAHFNFAGFDYELQSLPSPIVTTQVAEQYTCNLSATRSIPSLTKCFLPATQPNCLWHNHPLDPAEGGVLYSHGLMSEEDFRYLLGVEGIPGNQ